MRSTLHAPAELASTSGRSCQAALLYKPFALPRQLQQPPVLDSRRRPTPLRVHASTRNDDSSLNLPDIQSPPRPVVVSAGDPYRAAGQRLERLISGIGSGEDELIAGMMMQEAPERRLAMALAAGSLISGGACLVCWVCGLDPAGGASVSLNSVQAGLVGALAAAPLVAAKSTLWTDTAREKYVWLEDVQQRLIDEFSPVLYQLTPAQTAVTLALDVVPSLLILFPAATAGIAKSIDMYAELASVELQPGVAFGVGLTISAGLVAVSKLLELTPGEEEWVMVTEAVANADRFYKLMGQGRDSSAKDADAAAVAFRAVALTWLARRTVAAKYAAIGAAAEVALLGGLWRLTNDFTAPLVVGLASAAVDFAGIYQSMKRPNSAGGGSNNGASAQ